MFINNVNITNAAPIRIIIPVVMLIVNVVPYIVILVIPIYPEVYPDSFENTIYVIPNKINAKIAKIIVNLLILIPLLNAENTGDIR
ncbi:hypothetical protein HS5_08500 [Acidianus sp. HS-5]|nr:hypothetical protein HS5_08500 [Acidianus sp. HS-5]